MPDGMARSDCGEQGADARPASFRIETFGTGRPPDAEIRRWFYGISSFGWQG